MAREEWFKDKEDVKQEPRITQMGGKKKKAFQRHGHPVQKRGASDKDYERKRI